MLLVCLVLMLKTFFYLRIFKQVSFLVSMLKQVMIDIIPFMTFFAIILFMFSLLVSVIDWGQYEYDNLQTVRGIQYTSTGPDKEYMQLHKLAARFIYVYRKAIGDNNYDASTYLPQFQNGLFWVQYVMQHIISVIIILNFVVAEVSNSYNTVKSTLRQKLLKEQGNMINEAEEILRSRFSSAAVLKWKHFFPKYIIKRELDH